MLELPQDPRSLNERALAAWSRQVLTGVTGATLTLQNTPRTMIGGTGLELLFKNGLLLVPGVDYTVEGAVVTLTVPAVNTDVFQVSYPYST